MIALDAPAADVLRSVAALEWASARFFVCDTVGGVGTRTTSCCAGSTAAPPS